MQPAFPLRDALEGEKSELVVSVLASPRVDPDDGLVPLVAQDDQVVVGRDDRLVRPGGRTEHDVVARAPNGLSVTVVSDVTRTEAQLVERPSDAVGKELVEKQPDLRALARGGHRRLWSRSE
jgi:hypothetical protein